MAQRNHNNLIERCGVIESIVVELQPGLTDAERAYQNELKGLSVCLFVCLYVFHNDNVVVVSFVFFDTTTVRLANLLDLSKVIDGMEKYVDTHSELFVRPSNDRVVDRQLNAIDNQKIEMIQMHLDEQNAELTELVSRVKELQLETSLY
jgi:hypothetical protein